MKWECHTAFWQPINMRGVFGGTVYLSHIKARMKSRLGPERDEAETGGQQHSQSCAFDQLGYCSCDVLLLSLH